MTCKDSNPRNPYDVELPQSVIQSFARFLLPEIRKFYESDEGKLEFQKYTAQQKSNRDS